MKGQRTDGGAVWIVVTVGGRYQVTNWRQFGYARSAAAGTSLSSSTTANAGKHKPHRTPRMAFSDIARCKKARVRYERGCMALVGSL
jgi:hypothetical protein